MCDSFTKNRFEYPKSQEDMEIRLKDLQTLIDDTYNLIQLTKKQMESSLDDLVKERKGCNCSYFE